MSTKVFISWSGELSRKLAEALRSWLPATLQYVKPYFTPEDVEKGAKWNSEITKELETSNVGIICLTSDNTEKPWILFEAGALSKSIEKARVCTLLFNLEPTDLKGPLTSFQGTRFLKEDFKRLINTINNVAGDSKLDTVVLDSVFEMWWPKLDEQIADILANDGESKEEEKRSDRDILEEILELNRMNSTRNAHSTHVSRRAVGEILEFLEEMAFVIDHEHGDLGFSLHKRLERPMRHLCMAADAPDLFDRFRRRRERYQVELFAKENKCDEPELPSDGG
ncbi:toll/interleukin-1 receptor domain-containing protein [Geobacter anodireducens]|uniref:Toll/interleukin-1 receptor domain-containing protein n=1 Tax=Geobacter anodireducens TaxID=1340425 RepID=A0ABR9NZI6_9BACT|nr:toll/interleukin-1 receptor domain-containing protein [Geobacter anodireducens]MBE2889639.1 toll/interleukin-1 receptor domain-containing protein [Geobacter anodireducens]